MHHVYGPSVLKHAHETWSCIANIIHLPSYSNHSFEENHCGLVFISMFTLQVSAMLFLLISSTRRSCSGGLYWSWLVEKVWIWEAPGRTPASLASASSAWWGGCGLLFLLRSDLLLCSSSYLSSVPPISFNPIRSWRCLTTLIRIIFLT